MKLTFPTAILLTGALMTGGSAIAGDANHDAKMQHADDRSSEQMISDSWLDGKLESALLFNDQLNSFAIDTEVKQGIAYLNGAVESEIDIDLAGEVAQSVEGITKVKNNLVVDAQAAEKAESSEDYQQQSQWRQSVDNATLTAAIKTKLLLNEHTDGLDMNVDSMNGVVTLTGTVSSEEESELAEQIAKNADGSHEVNNRLVVKKSSS